MLDLSPPIWRRIEVPYDFNLHQMHLTIQAATRWKNYHLYGFRVGRINYSLPNREWPDDDLNSKKTNIKDLLLLSSKPRVIYEYDYGGGWEHEVIVQGLFRTKEWVKYPRRISGRRACPPEDCGGSYG